MSGQKLHPQFTMQVKVEYLLLNCLHPKQKLNLALDLTVADPFILVYVL